MAIDLKLSHASIRLGRKLAAGTVVEQEGVLLCAVIEDGIEKAALVPSVIGTEHVIGFAYLADALPTRTAAYEEDICPASGTLEIDLAHQNLVVGRVRAVDLNTSAVLVIDPVYAGATAAGQVKVDHAAGKAKFHAGQASHKVAFTYLYDLTLTEAKARFGQRNVNNQGLHAEFGQCELGSGLCELYTDQFDASAAWAAAASVNLGDNGILAVGGAGPALNAVVVSVPGGDNPMLGVRIQFMP